ncbi:MULTISPECIES: phosphatase PAP2 family protein [Geobacillus]|uniref:Phosphatase PAP2 family protein n=1 Tax=Geobacillus thermocatenulatus TaxID=33938 RepID=A0A226Q1E0_9BACL|nr:MULTISPECIES: phosphatase PAP2 family protein [Geobacillus]ASS99710.1 phosphatase PAP2 family protein [Geobacillus thermocatenulatus]KLR72777.1 phosphoesterase [Geobacillus sp. T6]KPD00981.1 phosphatidylglycerophosphatase B [Geobacillus sp. BCO2]OXB86115.1 phosphatase PAP2 family protein [Geobacillus thermocatenulatus]
MLNMNRRLWITAAMSLGLFLLVWTGVASGWTERMDEEGLRLFDHWKWLDPFTFLGNGRTIGIISIMFVIGLWFFRRDVYGMVLVVIAVGGGYGINEWLKHAIGRARPPHAEIGGFSFPSGHAMIGTIYLLLLAYFLAQTRAKRGERAAIYGVFAALALLTGLSRLSLQVHYPSDVLGGFGLGGAYLAVCLALYRMWTHRGGRL